MKHIASFEGEVKTDRPSIDWDKLPDPPGEDVFKHPWGKDDYTFLYSIASDTIRVCRGEKRPADKGYPDHIGSREELDQIVQDGDSVGVLSGREGGVVVLDYDSKHPAHAEIFDKHAVEVFGPGWLRTRKGAGKRGRVYRMPSGVIIRGRRLDGRSELNVIAFKAWAAGPQQNRPPKPDTCLELRGARQQTVLWGVHPDGTRYETHATSDFADLPAFDPEKWPSFVHSLQADLERIANVTVEKDGPGGSIAVVAGERKVDQSTLLADDPEEVVEAYQQWAERRAAQGIHDEHMPHNDFIALLAATKGALGDDMEAYYPELVEYFPGGRDTDGRTEYTYASFYDKDVTVGWSRLCQLLGYMPPDTFPPLTDEETAAINRATPDETAERDARETMFVNHVYVSGVKRFHDLERNIPLDDLQFDRANTGVADAGLTGAKAAHNIYLNHPRARRAVSYTYRPGQGHLVAEDDGLCANTWRPGVEPRRGAVPRVWLEHGNWLLGEEQFKVLCQWLAYMMQNPGVKIGWTPVIIGAQGLGKDALFSPIRHALGARNVACIDFGRLTDRFNSDWAQKQFVIANEAKTSDRRKAADVYNQLKTLFSSIPAVRKVEEKNIPIWYAPNIQVGVILSNHHDAVALEHDDRRFGVFQCVPTRKPNNHEDFFASYFGWCPRDDAPGAGAAAQRRSAGADVAGYLHALDVSGFKPETAPDTAAKRAMIRAHRPNNAETWTADAFGEDGILHGRDVIAFDEFQGLLKQADHCSSTGMAAQLLEKHGFSKRKSKIPLGKNGPEKSLWFKSGNPLVTQLSPAALAARYLKQSAETLSLVSEMLKSEGWQ